MSSARMSRSLACRVFLASMAASWVLLSTNLAVAQQPMVTDTNGAFFNPDLNTYFRLRHIDGQQFGATRSFTSGGATHYVFLSNGTVLINAQGRVTNDGEGGGTVGIIRRYLVGESILGGGVFYDAQNSRFDHFFQQLGLSLELLRDDWSIRANGYFNLGTDTYAGATGEMQASTLRYQGNNILFDLESFTRFESAMDGFEAEIARSIANYSAEAFAGYYHLAGGGDRTDGFKAGLRGYLTERIAASVAVTHDSLLGTHAFGGVSLFFGGSGGNAPRTLEHKLTIPVERSEQVAVNEKLILAERATTILTDPVSTENIFVVHVDSSAAPGGDGTFETPLNSLDDVFANSMDGSTANGNTSNNGNIVFVHSGSSFSGQSVSLRNLQRFLGEGITHTVDTAEAGLIIMPAANGPGSVPLISGAPVNAITLGSTGDNEVSGFMIDGGTRAIKDFGAGAVNTHINRVAIRNTSGNGIEITPSTNTTIDNVTFDNVGGSDIVLNAHNSTIANVQSSGAVGGSIQLQNLTGTTTIENVEITNAGGFGGILLENAQSGSETNLSDVVVAGSIEGLSIKDSMAESTISIRDLEVSGAADSSIDIDNNDADITFHDETLVTDRGATGIDIDGGDGTINFDTATITGGGDTTAAIDVQNTGGEVAFETVNVSGSGGPAVYVENAASFSIGANGAEAGDGGTIAGAVDGGIIAVNSNVVIRFMDISEIAVLGEPEIGGSEPGDGITYLQANEGAHTVVFDNNRISNVANNGINTLVAVGSVTATITNNQLASQDTAILIQGTEGGVGSATLTIDDNVLSSVSGGGIETTGTVGLYTITSLRDNVVTAAQRGIALNDTIVFDADPSTPGLQTVSAGTTILGSAGTRLSGTGMLFDSTSEGTLVFDDLQLFTNGFGISYYNSGGSDFNLEINGGQINTTSNNMFHRGIQFVSGGGGSLTLNNINLNLNNAAAPIGISLSNDRSAVADTVLSGTGNTTTGVVNFKQVTGDNFDGTIIFDGGARVLP